jgi:hypothetical protein
MIDTPTPDDRERRLIDAVLSLAKSFREEHDRLAQRLTRLEQEIDTLNIRLDAHERAFAGTIPPGAPPPDPSRTRL